MVRRIYEILTNDLLFRDLIFFFWYTFRSIFNKLLYARGERNDRRSVLLSLLIFVLVRLCSLLWVFLHICIHTFMYICKMLMLAQTYTRLLRRCYIFTPIFNNFGINFEANFQIFCCMLRALLFTFISLLIHSRLLLDFLVLCFICVLRA